MSKVEKISNKNAAIQEMMSSGNGLMNFYRFVAQNPHLSLREACQIVVERSNASVCFSYEEWNAMGRRINKGSKGIPYVDTDGQKRFVYDSNDTHGDGRYKRLIYPMKRLLKGLDVLNGTEISEKLGGDYKKIQSGVSKYLNENDYFTDDEEHDKLLTEGVSYFLYSKTGFPKSNGINLSGLPYDLKGNADFFMNVKEVAEYLGQEIERAYVDDLNKVVVIDDTEEENVSDEPFMPSRTEIAEEEITPESVEVEKPVRDHPLNPIYEQYMEMQKKYPNAVVLYRLGDFYEIFGEKAKTIGEELELTITGRDFGLSERVPMVGFPYHVTDKYISKITEKHGVLVLEPDAEPKYILSHEEAANMDSEQEKPKRPALEPIRDEELNKELDGLLSERQRETEEDDEITDEDWEEAESYLYGDEEESVDSEQEETAVQPQKKEEKSIRERKKKQKPQLSLFDLIDGNAEGQKEETYEDRQEKLIKRVLCGGSGFSQGKFRIVERYNSDPSAREFATFLKDEYGIGGSYGDGLHITYDSKGIRAELIDKENPENNTDFLMNWNEVATKIADFIDNDEYFNAEEKEEYKQFIAERMGTVQERNNAIIDHIIKEAWDRDARGYYRVWFSSLYAGYKYLTDHADEINEELVKRDGISDAYSRGEDFFVYGQALDEKTNFTDNDLKLLERKRELLESAKSGYIGIRIQTYAEYMFLEGTTSTNNGNWVFYFDEFGEEENFVRENAAAIGKELCLSKGVENLSIDDDCIDVNFYTDFCPKLREEKTGKPVQQKKFNRFKDLAAANRKFFEEYSARSMENPTNSLWGEVQSCTVIANGIYSVSTAGHGGIMVKAELADRILSIEALKAGQKEDGYYCYEEDCDQNIPLRELYDKGILTKDNKYFTRSVVKSEDGEYKQLTSLTDTEKERFFKEWNDTLNESLAYWNKEYWQAHESITTAENRHIERPIKEQPITENTDLTEIGFDQSELGGLKARFQANLDAIRLLNTLYDEDRLPTKSEQLTLAKYVGWGGLAKAFDEHDDSWQKEYNELKAVLSPEDYEKAKASVLNAHYTSKEVIQGIYSALSRFGVRGNNRILEPAMGTGNFFGYMPKEIAENARLYGVELDTITGKLSQKLYPNANIQIKGFEQTSFSNDRFDIVVGNVPFGAYTVYDSDYAKQNFYIHDYFLAKSIDKLKPDGIMAVITSSGTMDKLNPSVRKYLAERAELLGAIRLPNTAFKQNAGTEVVADILFFRKREQQEYITPENTEWLGTGKTEQGYEINNYFINHPEMVLGTLVEETGMYGATAVTVKPDGRSISEALAKAVEHLPQDIYVNPEYTEEDKDEISVDYNVKPLCFKAENGKLFMRVGDRMEEQDVPKSPKDAYERISEMINLRNELRYVLEIQTEGCSDEKLESEQRILNANYDRFVKRYGRLNSQTNTKLFREDADSALLFACEDISEDKTTITKADIFSKRTIRPYTVITSTDDCFEALQISRNERGTVDISYIEELTGKDYDTVLKELDTAVFRNPTAVNPEDKYSGFETQEEYLSGNVVKKLETAKRFAEGNHDLYDKNVKALESVQPEPVSASDIGIRIGASWISPNIYAQFLCHLLDLPKYYSDAVEIYYNRFDSSWRVDKKSYINWCSQEKVNQVYGTGRANAYRLFEDCLNLRDVKIYDKVENDDGSYRRVLNQAETIAAREKQNKIREEFADWIFSDPDRREALEKVYNETFNHTRLPVYDGSYLRFPGMNPAIELKPHQKNAVHRIVSTGDNTLLHHVVGSGKTFTMLATGMKLRQYGLAKKIMCAVPNHLVEQWAAEGRKLYPNAKILVATKEDLAKDKRQRFVSKVAMGDWDFIIIAQSSFAKIPISAERQIRKIQEEIQRIEETVENLWMEKGMPRGAVKNLEKIKKNREAQLKKLLDDDKKDNVLIFENLGVDYLFIDEAHYYKNKFLFTKMNNVAGISTTASQRASDLELKCEYINELHGGDKGVVFATGTPISNSMTEMYTMQSYLQKEKLQEVGITFFDNWAANFGETVTSLEMAPSGQGYKAKTRFAKFTNLPELLTMYRSFSDVQTQDMVKLDVPEVERKVINLKPSDTVLNLAEEIAERAEEISQGHVPPEEDNMLKITSDGKKLALDPRCFERSSADEKGSKLNECVSRIYEIWERTADIKGTQIVFCDLSTPKKSFDDYVYGQDFDVYNDLKYKLVATGIPKEEIAFIHDPKTDEQKQDLFNKVNAGKVRVLIGSTEKCGAGTNVQERLVALHHLDTPYRPSDMQQREGRIVRQGNKNKQVQIYTYVTERTFDSYSYQILENKQKFISQIDRGDLTVREAEDIDERTLTYAEIKAITAANPKIKRKMEVDTEIARLRVLEGQYKKNLYALQDKVRKTYPEEIQRQTLYLERLRADIATVKEKYNPEVFTINVQGKTYTEKKEGAQALMDALMHNRVDTVVAEYGGLKISLDPIVMISAERSVTLTGIGKYSMNIGESANGLITRLDNFLDEFPLRENRAESKLEQLKSDLKVAEEQVNKPFEHKDRLAELVKEQAELNAELDLNRREEVVIDDEKDDTVVAESDEEQAMALPTNNNYSHRQRQVPRKRVSKAMSKTYTKVKNEEPSAYVFIRNGSNYEIYGEQAKELSEKYELPIREEEIAGEVTSVLSVESVRLDGIIQDVISKNNKVKIIEEIMEEKEESFIDEEPTESKAELLPDYSISQEQMHEYGYLKDDMLPLRKNTAKLLYEIGLPVKILNSNNTDEKVPSLADILYRKEIHGIKKADWQEFLQSDKGYDYLYSRYFLSESVVDTLNKDMSYMDGQYVDGLSNAIYEEKESLKEYLSDDKIPVNERMNPFVVPLLDYYVARFEYFPLASYGWDKDGVYSAIAKNVYGESFRNEVIRLNEERELHEFIDGGLRKSAWIDENNFSTEDVSEIVNDLKPYFENSKYDGGFKGADFDKYYDEFAEDNITPYLESKAIDRSEETGKIDYAKEVMKSVEKEFDEFRDNLIKEPSLNVFHKNYEIHVKTELYNTINGGIDFEEEVYKTLYEDRGHILQTLYDNYLSATVIDNERFSVATYGDTSEFIEYYCEQEKEYKSEENEEKSERFIYFGKDDKDVAYYHFKYDGLGLGTPAEISEKANGYVIAANYLVMSQEDLMNNDITFLKVGRDITEEELSDKDHAIESMQNAIERIKQAKKQDLKDNIACKNAIETAISKNFDGMHLKDGFINEVIAKHGLSRVKYVLSNTVQQKEYDYRFSSDNKGWGFATEITEPKEQRYLFTVESHPAVLNGFIDLFRKKEKRFEESMQIYFTKMAEQNADGTTSFQAYILNDDTGEMFPAFEEDFKSKEALDEAFNNFAYRNGFDYYEKKPEELLKMSNDILKEKEGQKMPQNENTENKKKWITVLTAKDALLKKYEKSSLLRMPTTGDYAGYTYFLFNDRIKDAYQTTDIQSDSRELAYSLRIGEDETIRVQNRETEDMVELSAEEFKEAVGDTTSKDYVRLNDNGEKRWTNISVPRNAVLGEYDKSSLIAMPKNSDIKGSFYVPNSFVSEDTESDEERLRISVPDDFTFTVTDKEKNESVKISAYQLFRAINNSQESDYEREKVEQKTEVQPQKEKDDSSWRYVSVDKAAFITEYENSDMFRMPEGSFGGYVYFMPHGLIKSNEEKGTIRFSFPEGFIVTLNNNNAKSDEEKKIEMSAEDFIAQVRGKTAEDYEQYKRPSESKVNKFADAEERLRENVPEEMKNRPNWVIVRTRENEETGRLEKYLIDVHTGKFAESDNPETWTDFDTACKYAKENGGVALAYALDGKDNICCIDLDHCYDEQGNPSELVADLIDKTRGSFAEKSVSGKGVHIFGKTKGMDVRAFSKDGKSEFYQKSHFITMTGDVMLKAELKDFDSLPIKDYLYDKHERRVELKGKGRGLEGLSVMTDRDVVEKAISSKGGDTFKALYNGQDLQNNHSNSDMSLMNRLAFWCNGDKEQMLRIFATSGLFRENKSPDYYESTAIKAIRDTTSRFQPKQETSVKKSFSNNSDKGGK